MGLDGISIWQLVILLIVIVNLWLGSLVLKKAGYPIWWSLTLIVPLVNIIMIWGFANGDWPVEKKQ